MFRRRGLVVLERIDLLGGLALEVGERAIRREPSCSKSIDQRGEVLVHHRPVAKFGEGPAAKAAERVDARDPEFARRLRLGLVALVA